MPSADGYTLLLRACWHGNLSPAVNVQSLQCRGMPIHFGERARSDADDLGSAAGNAPYETRRRPDRGDQRQAIAQ